MSRQDKAVTERHARELRELVKQPDNKMCADCRRNDARWASWNLGVFVCIRCSGIHRSMGTHISKVKSIDLDIWQPEQLANIKKWGNRRANLYWERHLKAGHVPPEHKIESFIRSKYESRRWAMEGPPPTDPSVLDAGSNGVPPPPVPTETRPTPTSSAPQPRPSTHTAPTARVAHPLLSTQTPSRQSKPVPQVDLLNADFGESASSQPQPSKTTSAPTAAPGQAAQPPALESVVQTSQTAPATTSSGAGLFDLDFKPPAHGKTTSHAPTAKKSDIMSLFATPSPTTNMYNPGLAAGQPQQNQYASWSGGGTDTSVAGVPAGHRPREPSLSGGMAGLNLGGVGMSGNVWASSAAAPSAPTQTNAFAPQYAQPPAPVSQPHTSFGLNSSSNNTSNHFFSTQDVWGTSGATTGGTGLGAVSPSSAQKPVKDPFANIWE